MSTPTKDALEQAIIDHFQGTLDGDSSKERRGAVVIDWVVGFTISNVAQVDGEEVVGYHNEFVSPDTNPNAQAHLAQWVSVQLSDVLDQDDYA